MTDHSIFDSVSQWTFLVVGILVIFGLCFLGAMFLVLYHSGKKRVRYSQPIIQKSQDGFDVYYLRGSDGGHYWCRTNPRTGAIQLSIAGGHWIEESDSERLRIGKQILKQK